MVTGTLPLHGFLEEALSSFLGTEASLVFPSGYHANAGVLESLVGERGYVFCHPSLADGLRLSRARIFAYRNNGMEHLEDRLRRSRAARFRVIVTDGVFPLDGAVADLRAIVALASKYEATVIVYGAQGVGVLGEGGRGTPEHLGVAGQVDVTTGSFAHALGVGAGGYVSGRRDVVEWLRQKSRPYLGLDGARPGAGRRRQVRPRAPRLARRRAGGLARERRLLPQRARRSRPQRARGRASHRRRAGRRRGPRAASRRPCSCAAGSSSWASSIPWCPRGRRSCAPR